MKELKLFVCETCGTRYNDKRTCKECEDSHVKPKQISGARYVAFKNNKAGYPCRILVEFEDGEILEYSR